MISINEFLDQEHSLTWLSSYTASRKFNSIDAEIHWTDIPVPVIWDLS